jgi:hypothetical protein
MDNLLGERLLSLGFLLQALPECPGEYVEVLHEKILGNDTWKRVASGEKGLDLNDISKMFEELNADSEFYVTKIVEEHLLMIDPSDISLIFTVDAGWRTSRSFS